MAQQPLGSYLRTHRKKAGLTQHQLALLLGHGHRGSVSRHECAASVPPLPIALQYEAIFRVPISDLFPGVYQAIESATETRLAEMESALQQKSARDRNAKATARILEWMCERRIAIDFSTDA